jgi:hypothetical protein
MDDVVRSARATLERLESELARATNRATELQTERRKLSFEAHSGDKGARKALDAANAASATAILEIENVRSALDEGRRRLAEAERAADNATQRANAGQVKEIAQRVERRGPAIAAGVAKLCEEFSGLSADLDAIRALKAPVPQQRLVELGFSSSVRHQLQRVGFDVGDHVPPALRYTPEHLASAYARGAIAWASSVLGDSKTEEAAA